MDRETINISIWDDKTMRYTNEIEYKNNLLDEYIPSEKKSKKDVKEQIALLMPFLELDEPVFNLVPVDKKGIGKNE
jgi:hypothetical protein